MFFSKIVHFYVFQKLEMRIVAFLKHYEKIFSPFDICGISIPGGTIAHASLEQREGAYFSNISYILLAMGTNNVLHTKDFESFNADKFEMDLLEQIQICRKKYPQTKVSYSTFVSITVFKVAHRKVSIFGK